MLHQKRNWQLPVILWHDKDRCGHHPYISNLWNCGKWGNRRKLPWLELNWSWSCCGLGILSSSISQNLGFSSGCVNPKAKIHIHIYIIDNNNNYYYIYIRLILVKKYCFPQDIFEFPNHRSWSFYTAFLGSSGNHQACFRAESSIETPPKKVDRTWSKS